MPNVSERNYLRTIVCPPPQKKTPKCIGDLKNNLFLKKEHRKQNRH